jgi:BASS family bile acid:Na+ symporter
MLLVNCILAFVMFGVALSIRVSTFKSILKNPKSVIWGLMLQWFALPALTCLLTIILNPIITPMVALGMILVASCPGGNVSNFLSSLSKGNVELSVSMTAITTLFASIITPFNFWFWGTHYCKFALIRNKIPTLDIPFSEMLSQIILILGIPIVLGLICSHYFPKFSKKIIKPSQVLSIICFIAMVIVSMTQVLAGFEQRWDVYAAILSALVIVVIHNLTALATGYYGGKVAKLPKKDCRTLSIEIGIQNSGLALALLFNPAIFDPSQWKSNGGIVIIAALWGIWHIISGLGISYKFRRKDL